MLLGAALFAEAYPVIEKNLLAWGALGKITLPGVLHVNPWIVIPVLAVVYIVVFIWFERKDL
jgi:hypothetical protein